MIFVVVFFMIATVPIDAEPSFQGVGDLTGGGLASEAHAVSADGSVVVGWSESASGMEAFRWENGQIFDLDDLPDGIFYSYATDVSSDGSVVVGQGYSTSGNEAFHQTSAGGMEGLGDLPGGGFYSHASGVSTDGSVVAG